MGSQIILSVGGTEYTISAPEYGYTTKIVNPFHFQRKLPFGYSSYDDGTSRDVRIFSGTLILPFDQAKTFLDFYSDDDKGRAVEANMRLRKNSGFTPFGPDKGDYGNYGVVIHSVAPSGAMVGPYKHFSINFSMTAQSYPSVTAPPAQYDGSFSLGSVTGLRFPDGFPQSDTTFGFNSKFTRSGTGKFMPLPAATDHYESSLKMVCCRSRAYELINYLTDIIRTNNIGITAQAGTYLFGAKKGTSGTYVCQWIDEELTIKHSNFNRYEFEPTFSLVSVS